MRYSKLNFKGNADTKFLAYAGSVGDTTFATVVPRARLQIHLRQADEVLTRR